MKRTFEILGLVLLAAACRSTTAEQYAAQESTEAPDPMNDPELMAKMMALATPGEPHAEFAKGVGNWTTSSQVYMSPGAEPLPMTGTATSKLILGGRFLQQNYQGDMMGMPFEGQLLLGYDNLQKQYFTIWMDTWGTGYTVAKGKENKDGEIVMRGKMKDAITPEGRPFRQVSKSVSDDEMWFKMYDTLPDGTEWMVMELTYKRAK